LFSLPLIFSNPLKAFAEFDGTDPGVSPRLNPKIRGR
jgi:hypothetical protein